MYFIAVLPPPEIDHEIRSLKLEIKEKYQAESALKLPAHITLIIPFSMPEEEEGSLREALKVVAGGCSAFRISLSGFGHFGKGVIFVKIEDHRPVVELHERILSAIKEVGSLKLKETDREIHPHINIASRNLRKEDFSSAWKSFKEREFSASFLADQFILFRHNGKSWDLQEGFPLGL